MWLFIVGSFLITAYCVVYMVHCIKSKAKLAAIGAAILSALPAAFGILLACYSY